MLWRSPNIKHIARGGFANVYSATWIDGKIERWDQGSDNWKRSGSKKVALKILDNSNNISEDFLNEVTKIYMFYIFKMESGRFTESHFTERKDVSQKNWLALCCITDNSAQISVSVKRPFGEMYRNL